MIVKVRIEFPWRGEANEKSFHRLSSDQAMRSCYFKVVLGILGLTLAAASANAQTIAEVKVQATRFVTATRVGRTTSGVPIQDLSLEYGVSVSDLDLETPGGVAEANRRIKRAAMEACREISRQYPNATPSDEECAKAASNEAIAGLYQLLAAEKTRE